MDVLVVGECRTEAAEGMQRTVVSLVDGLRALDRRVEVVEPRASVALAMTVLIKRPRLVIFVHGPGSGVVLRSWALRRVSTSRIAWVATRPDLAGVPLWMRGRRTAHDVFCNGSRKDLLSYAEGAVLHETYIGIDPQRFDGTPSDNGDAHTASCVRALHVGHLRQNRGLELLAQVKQALGDRIEISVLGSPTFPPDASLVARLTEAGVNVRREFVPNMAAEYSAVDLYLFPTSDESGGAVELPLSVLEALAAGTRIVTTNYGAIGRALVGVRGVQIVRGGGESYVEAVERSVDEWESFARPEEFPEHLDIRRLIDAIDTCLEGGE